MEAEIDDEIETFKNGLRNHDEDEDEGNNNNSDDETVDVHDDAIMSVEQKPKSNITLAEAEDKLRELREYAEQEGLPEENNNMLLRVGTNFRNHNTAKHRQQTSMRSYLK